MVLLTHARTVTDEYDLGCFFFRVIVDSIHFVTRPAVGLATNRKEVVIVHHIRRGAEVRAHLFHKTTVTAHDGQTKCMWLEDREGSDKRSLHEFEKSDRVALLPVDGDEKVVFGVEVPAIPSVGALFLFTGGNFDSPFVLTMIVKLIFVQRLALTITNDRRHVH